MIGSYKEKAIKGDYIGFTFNGVHSSDLGIVRVSNGSRYNSNLLPALSDIKGQVQNGRDGTAYFGSTYTQTPINLEVAFDKITEVELNKMKRLFGDKNPHYLWFDETPYKEILVKIAQPPQFNYIAFDETHNGGSARVYKGDAKINFISYTPYARSRVAFLDSPIDQVYFKYAYGEPNYYKIQTATADENGKAWIKEIKYSSGVIRKVPLVFDGETYIDERGEKYTSSQLRSFPSGFSIEQEKGVFVQYVQNILSLEYFYNYDEWKEASRLKTKTSEINKKQVELNSFKIQTNQEKPTSAAYVYNAGDVEVPIYITYQPGLGEHQFSGDTLTLMVQQGDDWKAIKELTIGSFSFEGRGFIIDSKLKNIKELGSNNLITGNVYTDYITKGDFFKIPANENGEFYKIVSENCITDYYTIEHPHLYYF